MPPRKAPIEGPVTKNGNGGNLGFEADLFLAADKLRKNLEPPDYKHVVLGLVFLRALLQMRLRLKIDTEQLVEEPYLARLDRFIIIVKKGNPFSFRTRYAYIS